MNDLKGKKILVTSGPTRAYIDAVRFISNYSSGRLGTCIAVEAVRRGALVTMLAGTGGMRPGEDDVGEGGQHSLKVRDIETVEDLINTLREELTDRGQHRYHAIVHAMAVLDYVPVEVAKGKLKSGKDRRMLELQKTPKVIDNIRKWSPDSLLIGFKLESDTTEKELVDAAFRLIERSGADIVVANDRNCITEKEHKALFVDSHGRAAARAHTKPEIARYICNIVAGWGGHSIERDNGCS